MRLAAAVLGLGVAASAAVPIEFSAEEIARIAELGPWPVPAARDPSNRASGQPDAVELGRRLFFDPRLSPLGYIACVTCHQPDRAWTDLKPRAHGLGDVDRNTQALNNLRLQRWFGWGGSSDSLWMASLRPILDAREMDSNPAHARRVYTRVPEYACLYQRTYGVDPVSGPESDEAVLVHSAKALAAFVETLGTDRTPFDDLRDALLRGEPRAANGVSAAALRGLRLFVGKAGCVACHRGPNFSDGEFHDTAVPPFVAQRRPDAGRQEGITSLRSSRYTLRGRYSDATQHPAAPRPGPATGARGSFRTPSLRNVADTAPYMHNGGLDSLQEVLQHYARLEPERLRGSARQRLRKLDLSPAQTEDLIAFLHTLSDARGPTRGLPQGRVTPCDTPETTAR
jgi:cytochrome c peroxidase